MRMYDLGLPAQAPLLFPLHLAGKVGLKDESTTEHPLSPSRRLLYTAYSRPYSCLPLQPPCLPHPPPGTIQNPDTWQLRPSLVTFPLPGLALVLWQEPPLISGLTLSVLLRIQWVSLSFTESMTFICIYAFVCVSVSCTDWGLCLAQKWLSGLAY